MSSINGASKHSHHNGSSSSGLPLPPTQQKSSSGSRSHRSHKPRKQSSSSMDLAESTAVRTSSPKTSHRSSTTPMPDSTSDLYRTFNTDISDWVAYAQVNLLQVSAWTHPHHSPHDYQDFSFQSYDSNQTSTCTYHVSMMGSDHNSAWSGYGLAPLQRWLDEDVRDGGAMELQLGYQLRADCTCIAMQDGVGMDVVSGTKHGAGLQN